MKDAKVFVNFSPIGLASYQECNAIFCLDTFGRPKEIQIFLDGLPTSTLNELLNGQFHLLKIFGNPEMEGHLADETKIQVRIAFVKKMECHGSGTLVVHCHLGQFQIKKSGTWSDCEKWVFQLANLKLYCGDIPTDYPAPLNAQPTNKTEESDNAIEGDKDKANGMVPIKEGIDLEFRTPPGLNSWRLNRITFKFVNRNWNIDEGFFGQWPSGLDEIGNGPILSGTLSTVFNEGDTDEQLQLYATDIAELLSFALSRDVKWVSCGCQKKDGEFFSMRQHYPFISPFNHHWFPVVDNFTFKNLKVFLEIGLQKIQSDRHWWLVTIRLLTQARISKYSEVKCSLLNTLLDRISTKLNSESNQAEIDPMLEENLNEVFEHKLHKLMIEICVPWTIERTKNLCSTIKQWNSQPSFPDKIIRSCEKLKIYKPCRKTLGLRHKILHNGEFDSKLNDAKKLDYLLTLDAVASLLLIRIFEFAGYIYLKPFGDNYLLVDQVLNTTAIQESYDLEY